MKVFRIKSSGDETVVELRPYDQEYFLASLTGRGINAQARVGKYMAEPFANLFEYLSTNWKGWKGERAWESLEGEFRLGATADLTGHTRINIHLHDGAPARWEVNTFVEVEAGQLERLAQDAREFDRVMFSTV